MKMENVRLDWKSILLPYADYLSLSYPREMVEKRIEPIIEMLNSNSIRSTAIFALGKPACYAFLTKSEDFSDRMYATIGFTSPEVYLESRLQTLSTWLKRTALEYGKMFIMNEAFNAPDAHLETLANAGFSVIRRIGMHMGLASGEEETDPAIPNGYSWKPITSISPEEFSDREYTAYSAGPEEPLFGSIQEERHTVTRRIFVEEVYGPVVQEASFVAYLKGKPCGCVLVTSRGHISPGGRTCMLGSIFVMQEFRKRGIGEFMLRHSMAEAAKAGYTTMWLMVNLENPAMSLYQKLGFTQTDQKETFVYTRP
ncbi:MAG: GNAT family N-acetyltransferase [Candidatus Thermoplasmatota archaeon]|jgi:ribosomal protein S18 acetylase RimI-like enzyme|nr:GNAT family N-acetyltransferase [Candidatus Thermoplasmatota archaeon]